MLTLLIVYGVRHLTQTTDSDVFGTQDNLIAQGRLSISSVTINYQLSGSITQWHALIGGFLAW
jgi:hypothetical protein